LIAKETWVSDLLQDRQVRRRLAVLHHVEEVTGNVAMSCRYFGISRQLYYTWLRRYRAEGLEGLRERSRRPHVSPNATHTEIVGKILYLRQHYHFGPAKIAMYLKRYHDVIISTSRYRRLAIEFAVGGDFKLANRDTALGCHSKNVVE
jgi:transposase